MPRVGGEWDDFADYEYFDRTRGWPARVVDETPFWLLEHYRYADRIRAEVKGGR